MILTVKNYTDFQKLNLKDNDFASEVAALSILSGTPANDIKTKDYDALKDALIQQLKPGTPVYMFKWKGKTYGYYPADIEAIGQVVELSNASQNKKWNILASLMFREVSSVSSFMHKSFGFTKKIGGIKCKPITTFKNNYLTYSCKKVTNWNKVDHSVWDDFPVYILMSNLNFSLGSGLQLSLNIPASSLTKQMETLQEQFQTLMVYTALSWTLLRTKDSTLLSSDGQTLQKSHQDNSLLSSTDATIEQHLTKMQQTAQILTGDAKSNEISAFRMTLDNIFSCDDLFPDTLRLVGTTNNALTIR